MLDSVDWTNSSCFTISVTNLPPFQGFGRWQHEIHSIGPTPWMINAITSLQFAVQLFPVNVFFVPIPPSVANCSKEDDDWWSAITYTRFMGCHSLPTGFFRSRLSRVRARSCYNGRIDIGYGGISWPGRKGLCFSVRSCPMFPRRSTALTDPGIISRCHL